MSDADSSYSLDSVLPWSVTYPPPRCFIDHWSSARGLVWGLVGIPGSRLIPPYSPSRDPSDEHIAQSRSWWLAALDLLIYGEGWTDIPRDLTGWRNRGYRAETAILGFIARSFGPTIAALEAYLYGYETARLSIAEYARRARQPELEDPDHSELNRHISRSEGEELINFVRELTSRHHAGHMIDQLLRSWDFNSWSTKDWIGQMPGDSAHLSPHFTNLWADVDNSLAPDDSVLFTADNSVILTTARYEGWYHKLHELRRDTLNGRLSEAVASRVTVRVTGLGWLGEFSYDGAVDGFRYMDPTRW